MTMEMEEKVHCCLFCYRLQPVNQNERSDVKEKAVLSQKQFFELLKRYLLHDSSDSADRINLLHGAIKLPESLKSVTSPCMDCSGILKSFCDYYEEMKVLEMKLNWRLQTLKDIVESSGKVRFRHKLFQEKLEQAKILDAKDVMKTMKGFRKKIVEMCTKKLGSAYPKVVLGKCSSSSSGEEESVSGAETRENTAVNCSMEIKSFRSKHSCPTGLGIAVEQLKSLSCIKSPVAAKITIYEGATEAKSNPNNGDNSDVQIRSHIAQKSETEPDSSVLVESPEALKSIPTVIKSKSVPTYSSTVGVTGITEKEGTDQDAALSHLNEDTISKGNHDFQENTYSVKATVPPSSIRMDVGVGASEFTVRCGSDNQQVNALKTDTPAGNNIDTSKNCSEPLILSSAERAVKESDRVSLRQRHRCDQCWKNFPTREKLQAHIQCCEDGENSATSEDEKEEVKPAGSQKLEDITDSNCNCNDEVVVEDCPIGTCPAKFYSIEAHARLHYSDVTRSYAPDLTLNEKSAHSNDSIPTSRSLQKSGIEKISYEGEEKDPGFADEIMVEVEKIDDNDDCDPLKDDDEVGDIGRRPSKRKQTSFTGKASLLGIENDHTYFEMHSGVSDHPRQGYTCSQCGKSFPSSSSLSRHRQAHRSLDSQKAKRCPSCGKAYVSLSAFSMHLLTHNLNHKCDACGKRFSRLWLLQKHRRSHTGEKPHRCAYCGKAFADRSNLNSHIQSHSSAKNFTCERCNKSFTTKSYLKKHYVSCFQNATM